MVYNWLFNEQSCLLCDGPAEVGASLCTGCESELPWLTGQCAVCALPLPTSGLVCGACLKRPPAFERVEAPWRFAFPVDTLIHRFKHQARWPLGRLMAECQARHLAHAFDEGLPVPQALLPVPLATRRLRQRGFNQAGLLADWLSKALGIPVRPGLLRRVQDTPAQQGLDARARRRNLRGAFALAEGADVYGQHLALVDDVVTTGATAEALARLLRRAGAARVDVYCLARTPRPGD
ncbi:ComF family protein [Stutzerimonas azotifigens]|uniref:ComF family protein n=1 Tax=Stutzerimonas azotifigens TaxID=291995 RepID=UPI00040C8471|nr:ComF family protein [Stutzerimonas azotifigens]